VEQRLGKVEHNKSKVEQGKNEVEHIVLILKVVCDLISANSWIKDGVVAGELREAGNAICATLASLPITNC